MKKVLFSIFLVSAISLTFSGCEKADYQHPMQRANG